MLNNFFMSNILVGSRIKLVARNNHNYDEDSWLEIDKSRLFLREYLLWVDKTNSLQDSPFSYILITEFYHYIFTKEGGKWNIKKRFLLVHYYTYHYSLFVALLVAMSTYFLLEFPFFISFFQNNLSFF